MPLIALLTDFGHMDLYVGVLKGVILGLCPQARIVDLCHEVPPGDLRWGAYQLWAARAYFPPGTIFVAVVDPGVGSERQTLALRAGEHFYVGPDNGLLSWAAEAPAEIVRIDSKWHLPGTSTTFHGRDIFAPAAARLAAGLALSELGEPAGMLGLPWPKVAQVPGGLRGEILLWDRFGNLISNISREELNGLGPPEKLCVRIGETRIDGLSACYADVGSGGWLALIGSSGLLEISLNGGDARQKLGSVRGSPVFVTAP